MGKHLDMQLAIHHSWLKKEEEKTQLNWVLKTPISQKGSNYSVRHRDPCTREATWFSVQQRKSCLNFNPITSWKSTAFTYFVALKLFAEFRGSLQLHQAHFKHLSAHHQYTPLGPPQAQDEDPPQPPHQDLLFSQYSLPLYHHHYT